MTSLIPPHSTAFDRGCTRQKLTLSRESQLFQQETSVIWKRIGYDYYHIFFRNLNPSIMTRIHILYFQAVSFAQGEALAKEFGIPFLETSAVESLNVDEAFNKLTQIVYDRLESTGMLSRRPSGSFKNSPTPANGGGSNYRQGSNVSSVDLNQQGGRGCCTG